MSTADKEEFITGGAGSEYSDRLCSAHETLARVEPFLLRFGITRVARHTGLDNVGIPVWCAYTPNSRSIVIAQGKGLSDLDAKTSAVMEALERAVAGVPDISPILATADELRSGGKALDTLPQLVALGQDDIRHDEQIRWTSGVDLVSGADVLVPLDAVILDRTRVSRFWISSDGLASGNTAEEAIFHGLLERIERDAYVLWQVCQLKERLRCCVDPGKFDDAAIGGLVEKIRTAGLALKLFDITPDSNVPCFLAFLGPGDTATNMHIRFVQVTSGCGAHLSPVRAVIRAITEAAQSRLTYISGARDDITPATFKRALPEPTRAAFSATPVPRCDPVPLRDGTLPEMLRAVVDRVTAIGGRSIIVVRLSRSDLPFSVVKVIVPDLEHPEGNRGRRFGSRALTKAIFA